jgi:hypothetical protein
MPTAMAEPALVSKCAHVRADAQKPDEPEVHHAGEAPHHVHAQRHERVDAGRYRHRDQIVFHQAAA